MTQIQIPISVGELFDRISILEIKLRKSQLQSMQQDITDELHNLRSISDRFRTQSVVPLIDQLCEINQELWLIEDQLRYLERSRDFGPGFVDLARQVYAKNDIRAKIKKQINAETHSQIKDYKIYDPEPSLDL